VEGQGEVQAFPTLLRRLLHARQRFDILVQTPLRCHRDQFLRDIPTRRRMLGLARLKAGTGGAVLVLLDGDDLCPKEQAPQLLAEINAALQPIACAMIFAVREFECWLIGGLDLARVRVDSQRIHEQWEQPESIRGAKEWLRKQVLGVYSPSVDQPALTATFDLKTAQARCASFDKLVRDLDRITMR
jgi:hypothetical protein